MMRLFLFWVLFFFWACSAPKPYVRFQSARMNQEVKDSKTEELMLRGLLEDWQVLKNPPYATWFVSAYEAASADLGLLADLEHKEDLRFKLYLGTWCGDTRRELPQWLKVFASWGLSPRQIDCIALDRKKQSGEAWEQGYGITRVPTLLVYRKNRYLGRITERPKKGFLEDLHDILSK